MHIAVSSIHLLKLVQSEVAHVLYLRSVGYFENTDSEDVFHSVTHFFKVCVGHYRFGKSFSRPFKCCSNTKSMVI